MSPLSETIVCLFVLEIPDNYSLQNSPSWVLLNVDIEMRVHAQDHLRGCPIGVGHDAAPARAAVGRGQDVRSTSHSQGTFRAHVEGGEGRSEASPTAILKDTHSVEGVFQTFATTAPEITHLGDTCLLAMLLPWTQISRYERGEGSRKR